MLWDSVQGQDGAVEFLRGAIARDRVVGAYLFTGPEGVGKALAGSVFARALICPERPGEGCGDCPDCREVARGCHPDVARMAPASKSRAIVVDQVREARRVLHLRARGPNCKVLLVEEADRMTPAAQNAFLKTLEEPPGKTVLVLVTSQPKLLLSTIRSRCQQVAFSPWPFSLMEPFLRERLTLSGEECFVLHSISGGCPGRALRFHREGLLETRREVIGPLTGERGLSAREASALAESWLDFAALPGVKLAAELEKERAEYKRDLEPKDRKDLEDRDKALVAAAEAAGLDLIFQLIFGWIRDLVLYSLLGPRAPLINRDLEGPLAASARAISPERAVRLPARVEESRALAVRAASRSARRLVLENLLIELGYWGPGK